MLTIVFAGVVVLAIFLFQVWTFYNTFKKDMVNNEYLELLMCSIVSTMFFDWLFVSCILILLSVAEKIGFY